VNPERDFGQQGVSVRGTLGNSLEGTESFVIASIGPTPRAAAVDDATLIARSVAEPEMFARLYDRYAADLHRYVLRRLGAGLAEDVVGETFLVAFRQRDRYDTGRPQARPWLYGIAANLIGSHRRTELRAYRALARTGADPVAESYADMIDGQVTAAASRAPLAAALRALNDGDRHVLLLVAWADFSYEEVAQALAIPLGTVRSRLNRARKKMRAALGGVDPTATAEYDADTVPALPAAQDQRPPAGPLVSPVDAGPASGPTSEENSRA
jgi:RNA polymerase sigma factor (sigma-70 family)